jgi:hypothetical protein
VIELDVKDVRLVDLASCRNTDPPTLAHHLELSREHWSSTIATAFHYKRSLRLVLRTNRQIAQLASLQLITQH